MAISGHVAKVLNSRELAINRGSDDGVQVGMRFAVLDPKFEKIKDPVTNAELGSLDRTKIEVEVVQVEKKLSLARTFKKETINVGGTGPDITGALSRQWLPPKYVSRWETLKTNDNTWEDLKESESFVNRGDPVRQVDEQVEAQQ